MFAGTALSVRLFVCAGLSLFIIYGPYLYVVVCMFYAYNLTHTHKRLYTVLPKYSKIQVLPRITSCRLMKYNKQAIELNSLLINNMPKDGYGWN